MINERIKSCLKENNLTQKNLSDITGITECLISRYASGERTPNIKNLVRLAKALNTTTDYLVGLDKECAE